MNVIIEKSPIRPPLHETKFSRQEGDEVVFCDHQTAIQIARQRAAERNSRQQLRRSRSLGSQAVYILWFLQDVR